MLEPDSVELRQRIRELLYDYALTHLTIDYVQFTESAVTELLSQSLRPVPLVDHYSLFIPPEPYDVFKGIHSLDTLPPYQEKLQINAASVQYLKDNIRSVPGKTKSERVLEDDDYGHTFKNCRPMSPVLSLRAQRQTPKICSGEKLNSLAKTLKSEDLKFSPVRVETEEEVVAEQVLYVLKSSVHLHQQRKLRRNIRWQLAASSTDSIRALYKSALDLTTQKLSHRNRWLDAARLCDDTSPCKWTPFEEEFVPIFPRKRTVEKSKKHRSKKGGETVLSSMKDLTKVGLNEVEVPNIDEDLYKENMVVVSGWQTIVSSPTPPPSDEDMIDELVLDSTPPTEPLLFDAIENSKLDVPEIPRSRRVGGKDGVGVGPLRDKDKSLKDFLVPLLPRSTCDLKAPESNAQPEDEPPRSSPLSMSMVGQALSTLNDEPVAEPGDDLELELKRLYAPAALPENPVDVILKEKIDAKEVPNLTPPNEHPADQEMIMPTNMTQLLAVPSGKPGQGPHSSEPKLYEYLKKAKGLASLRLQLSWVTFTTDAPLPSTAEITRVSSLLEVSDADRLGVPLEYLNTQIQNLVDIAEQNSVEDVQVLERRRWEKFDDGSPVAVPRAGDDVFGGTGGLLLSRKERMRASGTLGAVHSDESDTDLPVILDDINAQDQRVNRGERPRKRRRLSSSSSSPDVSGVRALTHEGSSQQRPTFDLPPSDCYVYDEENKENIPLPPSSFSDLQSDPVGGGVMVTEEEVDQAMEICNEGYLDYVLDEVMKPVVDNMEGDYRVTHNDGFEDQSAELLSGLVRRDVHGSSQYSPRKPLPTQRSGYNPAPQCDLASHALGVSAFAALRAKKVTASPVEATITPSPVMVTSSDIKPRTAPPEIFDRNTLRLPSSLDNPSMHRYLASLEFLQKQAIIRALPNVVLAERDTLHGVDVIVDPHTAVIIAPLLPLPSQCEALLATVSRHSWHYNNLLVVFEAYPSSHSIKSRRRLNKYDTEDPMPYAYTPPILKAIKKLRRDVDIAEACGSSRPGVNVQWAFADKVTEAAQYIRSCGDLAQERDITQGVLWNDERQWMPDEGTEDETNLAYLPGMNHFRAAVVLSQVTLDEFLDMSDEERAYMFSGVLGEDVLITVNNEIYQRLGGSVQASSDAVYAKEDEHYVLSGP
ncbi:hypothetical protein BDQ17DRAFT_1420071 [Cyathus striatus]|nr:hypothetical protein BDQ17DRAFT_1420071 [Cyathus striatus]